MANPQRNAYLKKKNSSISTWRQAEKDTYIQYMTDTAILTLNDPAIMGKDVFGRDRIEKFVKGWGENFDKFHGALEDIPEADYYQEKFDERLKRILGDLFDKFTDRYPWLKKQKY